MDAILFSANPKICNMEDAVAHLKTHSQLYFEVKFPILKGSFRSFPIDGFIHVSGTGDKVQYRVRIEDIVPFSKDHYEKPELYGDVRPRKWIKEWQDNINNIQQEPWKYALVMTRIDSIDIKMSALRNRHGKRAKAQQRYCMINPPKESNSTESQGHALIEDLNSIKNEKVDSTTKEALISARVGQGKFRTQVFQLWGNCCSVTGSATQTAIRASHIKPWRESTNKERLDPNNGLPLVASLDALFDAGLISFNSFGKLIVSSKLTSTERKIFGINEKSLTKKTAAKTAAYLLYHRRKHGFKAEKRTS